MEALPHLYLYLYPQVNATASILVFKWNSGIYTWQLQTNGLAHPAGMIMRVFVDLVNQPMVMNMTADQEWGPDNINYSGSEWSRGDSACSCAAAGRCLLCVHVDRARQQRSLGLHAKPAKPPNLCPPCPTLPSPLPACLPACPADFTEEQLQAGLQAAGRPDAYLDNSTPDIFLEIIDLGGKSIDELTTEQAAAAAPPETAESSVLVRRRRLHQEMQPDPFAVAFNEQFAANNTCGNVTESQIIGFLYNAYSRYKLKPVLKDSSSIPSTVSMPGSACQLAAPAGPLASACPDQRVAGCPTACC